MATVTITRSTHPDFLYFINATIGAKRIQRHAGTDEDVDAWVGNFVAAAERHAVTVDITDQR